MNGNYEGTRLERKSPHHVWLKWAKKLVAEYPNSLYKDEFSKYFLYGLGKQNIKTLDLMGLSHTVPLPETGDERSPKMLDIPALILLLHMIEVPTEARIIITDFLYEKGLLVLDKDLRKAYFDSPGDF